MYSRYKNSYFRNFKRITEGQAEMRVTRSESDNNKPSSNIRFAFAAAKYPLYCRDFLTVQ